MSTEDACPFYLVWRLTGLPPVYQHPTVFAAEREANRLAAAHPGEEFFVLAPISATVIRRVETRRYRIDEIPF